LNVFAAAVVLSTLAAAGCGGGAKHAAGTTAPTASTPSANSALPACAHHGAAVARPAGLPRSLPLPKGTVLTGHRRTSSGFLVVEGLEPLSLGDAARFLLHEIPKAGYRVARGESEGDEAETDFFGRGVSGHIKLRALEHCEGATRLLISIAPH
jgi:hypothetical protein